MLVPIYFLHRYQIEGVAKIVGGLEFTYALKGDEQTVTEFLDPNFQLMALDGLISTLSPNYLSLREELLRIIPPRAFGRPRTRESFSSRTGVTFDGTHRHGTDSQGTSATNANLPPYYALIYIIKT